jgi:hypothetical protein
LTQNKKKNFFKGLIRRGDLVVVSPGEGEAAPAPETPAEKYTAWLKQIFREAW